MTSDTRAFTVWPIVLSDGSTSHTLLGPDGVVEPVERYLAYLTDLGRSPNTVQSYAGDLRQWFIFLSSRNIAWQEATIENIALYVNWLRDRTNGVRQVRASSHDTRADSTINRKLAPLYNFYEFHLDTPLAKKLLEHRNVNQAVKAKARHLSFRPVHVTVHEERPKILSDEQWLTLLAACETWRDRLLLALLGIQGLRVGQALGLRHADIVLRTRKGTPDIWIRPRPDNVNGARAKTRRNHQLPLVPDVAKLYHRYMQEEYGDIDCDYVFVNLWGGTKGHPMTYRGGVIPLVDKLKKKSGVDFTCHMLRHTAATRWHRDNVSVEAISVLLTHRGYQVTWDTYIHLSPDDIRRELDGKLAVAQ